MLLGPADPLPVRPRRVLVAGTSGAGKTTLARRLGVLLELPHTELDALFHGPGWVPRPSFLADVQGLAGTDAWVTEWQYGDARPVLAPRAELLVWLDLPRALVLRRVVVRTLDRRLHRRPLFNGNVEPSLLTFFTDPEHIVRWAWSSHPRTGRRVLELARERPDLPVVRLRSATQVDRWLAGAVSALAG